MIVVVVILCGTLQAWQSAGRAARPEVAKGKNTQRERVIQTAAHNNEYENTYTHAQKRSGDRDPERASARCNRTGMMGWGEN